MVAVWMHSNHINRLTHWVDWLTTHYQEEVLCCTARAQTIVYHWWPC